MRQGRRFRCFLALLFLSLALAAGILPSAARAADYTAARLENQGKIVARQRFLTTTAPVIVFTFGGLSKQESLLPVLEEMRAQGMHGTFFVTERELQRNDANIRRILAYGQDLGIGLRPEAGADYAAYCAQIARIQTALQARYGVSTNVVRQMTGPDEAAIGEAVSAMHCVFVGQGLNIVQSKHKEAQSPDDVMPQIFGRWRTSLNRGEIAYLRMDFYTRPTLAAEMLRTIKEKKIDNIAYTAMGSIEERAQAERESRYAICSVQDVMKDAARLYRYPVDVAALPKERQPYERPPLPKEEFQAEFFKRYVGAPEVGETDRMLGFTRREIALADHTGIIKTVADRTVFLTFDDWGNDESVNKILYVLKKHNVHGTFFVITRSLDENPNLLRAIALAGNDIGSHTHSHRPMTVQDARGLQIPVMDDAEYDADVKRSYEHLVKTVGDITLPSGKPALTRLLRPPTLAVSRKGVEAILRHGFSYIVNGSGSTEDYSAVSMQSLVGIINSLTHRKDTGEVKRGAVVVMHMSTTANRTAQALDIVLTKNDALPEGDPKKFKVGLLSDYLVDGYDQRMKQIPPQDPNGR